MANEINPYAPFSNFVLRTPLLPLDFFKTLTNEDAIQDSCLKNILENAVIKEAIFLASPTLYFELEKWVRGKLENKKENRLRLSFLKYLSRMSSRCTPFGIFAGCTIGNFDQSTHLELKGIKNHRRFTRPDMNYLVALSQDLSKRTHIKEKLKYFPNSSLYRVGNQLRYIEYFYIESKRQHHIIEIDDSPYLQKVLNSASEGALLSELIQELANDSISIEEAVGFLDELLESQILTNALEPTVSGPPFIDQMLTVLKPMKGCEIEIEFLLEISKRFNLLDQKLGNDPSEYLQISSFLKEQPTDFELKYLFQTDLELMSPKCTLSKDLLLSLKKVMTLFNRISPTQGKNNLSRFKDAFYERYEGREMPLCQVLDVETGIGYQQNMGSGDLNPLVDDLQLPTSENSFEEQEIKLNKFHNILHKKLIYANKVKERTIRLRESDFEELSVEWGDLPNTLSTIAELTQDGDQTKILISGFSGSSAANLMGRFCHADSKITPFAKDIIAKEAAMEPDAILAEIVHLPEARVGNIIMRPSFREFEIPYLAQSTLSNTQKLPLEDLYISVRENRIFLRSKKNNKEVKPRLTNAHNYSFNSLPIYHFLADLQTQGLRNSIYFNFGPIDTLFDFLPRVEFDNLILHEATWRIRKEEIENLIRIKSQKENLRKGIKNLQKKKGIPQYVLLSDGDNQLLINLANITSILMLFETIKNREAFVLKEFLHHKEGIVFTNKEHYTNQVIVSFFNKKKSNPASHLMKK